MGAMALRLVATAAVLVPWLSLAEAHAADLRVPEQFATIQSAIDAAAGGDRILISAGIYPERLRTFGKVIALEAPDGPALTVVDGSASGSVLRCIDGETSATTFTGLTFRNGAAPIGAGVYANSSSPTFRDCIFDSNVATDRGGGVAGVNSRLTFENCVFRDCRATERGGAVYLLINSDTTFANCSFLRNEARNRNEASYGGAVAAESASDVSFADCAFEANKAAPNEGFTGDALGGALWLSGVTVSVQSCSFLGNAAIAIGSESGGGAIWSTGPTSIANGTFTENRAETSAGGASARGGAVYLESAGPIAPSIFAANSARGGTLNRGGALCIASGKTVDLSGCAFTSNRVESGSSGYGGAACLEVALVTASSLACMDNAIASCSSNSYGGAIYASNAMEVGTLTLEGNSIAFDGPATSTGGGGGLAVGGALTAAGGSVRSNTTRATSGSGGAITCGSAALSGMQLIDNSLAGGNGSVLVLGGALNGGELTIADCTFTNNAIIGTGEGGALAGGSVAISETAFLNCRIESGGRGSGGAIRASEGTITGCTFTDISASGSSIARGGAIYVSSSSTMTDLAFLRCSVRGSSTVQGGAIDATSTEMRRLTFTDCTAQTSNTNSPYGGAAYLHSNSLMEDCIFEQCHAKPESNPNYGAGGAVYSTNAINPVIRRTQFNANSAGQGASAALLSLGTGGAVAFEDCTVSGNSAASGNGAISLSNVSSAHFLRSVFSANTGASNGGAIACSNNLTALIEDCSFTDNSVSSTGGAVYLPDAQNVALLRSTFSRNSARASSGAVDIGRFTEITDCTFLENGVELGGTKGGALRAGNAGANGPITNSVFASNACAEGQQYSGDGGGGAIWAQGSIGAISLSTFRSNRASGNTARGGAIRALSIASIADTTFEDCTVLGNTAEGGAIMVIPTSTYSIGSVTTSTFTRCRALNENRNYTVSGGAISAQGGRLGPVAGCSFSDCSIEGRVAYGGAIRAASLEGISSCSFELCAALSTLNGSALGGALYGTNASFTDPVVENTSFTACRALVDQPSTSSTAHGGAIEWTSVDVQFDGCIFVGNLASAESALGGAANVRSTRFTNCEFGQNRAFSPTASALGGAVRLAQGNGPTAFTNVGFHGNVADGNTARGGAVIREDARVQLDGCILAGNASRDGGALYLSNGNAQDAARLTGCSFLKNSGTRGAAIRLENSFGLRIEDCEFAQNLAFDEGGALSLRLAGQLQPDAAIVHSVFVGNISTSGGAIRLEPNSGSWNLPVWGCVFSGNLAVEGGAILTTGGTSAQPALAGGIFCGNSPDDILGDWRDDGGNGFGSGRDCDGNGICDVVDLAMGIAEDCNANGVPDGCDILSGSIDSNADGVPDECQCIGDIVANGFVDGGDLSALLGTWGNASGDLSADLDGDGLIGGSDLALLLSNWGLCPR